MPTVVSTGRGPGGVQYPIGQSPLFQNRLGGMGGGLGAGYGLASQRLKFAGRKPGIEPPSNPAFAGLNQTGPNGEIYDPESFWNTLKGRKSTMPDAARLTSMATAARNYPGFMRSSGLGAAAPGYGDLGDSTGLKKLLAQRLAAVY